MGEGGQGSKITKTREAPLKGQSDPVPEAWGALSLTMLLGGNRVLHVNEDAKGRGIGTATIVLGRDPDHADVVLDDDTVSGRHARLRILAGELELEDLGSTNGSSAAGARLGRGGTSTKVRLPIPAVFELGEVSVFVQRSPIAPSRDPSGLPTSSAAGSAAPAPPVRAPGSAQRPAGRGSRRAPSGAEQTVVVESEAMRAVYRMVDRIADKSGLSVLLLGESGVGKEVVARKIHERSGRTGAFVSVPAMIPDPMAYTEYFGNAEKVFNEAIRRPGYFSVAHQGTIFLDEVATLSPAQQAMLLPVLQNRELTPLGDRQPTRVDVRVISATNEPLDALVSAGKFRGDLMARLSGLPIVVPPLRDRVEEISPLATFFAQRFAEKYEMPAAPELSPAALDALERWPWPGNVRELENTIQRAVALCSSGLIEPEDLCLAEAGGASVPPGTQPPGAPAGGPERGPADLSREERDRFEKLQRLIDRGLTQEEIREHFPNGEGRFVSRKTVSNWVQKYEEYGLRKKPPRPR